MAIGVTVVIIAIVAAAIWIFVEIGRFRHKLTAIFLIGLIILSYISFVVVAKKNPDVGFGSVDELKNFGIAYWAWLGGLFGNLKDITSYAIGIDWKGEDEIPEKKDPGEKKGWFNFK